MAKIRKKKKFKKIAMVGFVSACIITATTFTIGKYWIEIYDKFKEKKELEKQLEELKEKEAILKVDADKLQDPDYIARYAREKYLYSKDGEFILQIK